MENPENFGEIVVIGVDIGKDQFHLVGFDHAGLRVLHKKIKRLALQLTFEERARCLIGMDACMRADFLCCMLRKLGFGAPDHSCDLCEAVQ